ncbi:phasin family protein [Luteimonas rhizosphaerae]|nr:phasin family protein [Luteimonas sp. 4-12]
MPEWPVTPPGLTGACWQGVLALPAHRRYATEIRMTQSNRKQQSGSTRADAAGDKRARSDAEQLSKSISDSAQQIWLAGVGAFGRAQVEGSRLFEGLVKEGVGLEKSAREFADGRASDVRDAVGSRMDEARNRASETWDRLEKVLEARVQKTLETLGVPGRKEVDGLRAQVDALNAELQRRGGATGGGARKTTAKTATRKTPAKTTTGARPAKAATATARPRKTAAAKSARRRSAPLRARRPARPAHADLRRPLPHRAGPGDAGGARRRARRRRSAILGAAFARGIPWAR